MDADVEMEGEGDGGREKLNIIHRKREQVKNYGKRMFRKVRKYNIICASKWESLGQRVGH